jgi:DNA primase large subunit
VWSPAELSECAKYPFTDRAREVVRTVNFSIDKVDPKVLERAKQRVLAGIEDGIVRPEVQSSSETILLNEILSFPVAKIVVSLTGDRLVARRYADAEANAARKFLAYEKPQVIKEVAAQLGIGSSMDFVAYLNSLPRDERFRLCHVSLAGGNVTVSPEMLPDLIAETVRLRLEQQLAQKPEAPATYQKVAAEVKAEASSEKLLGFKEVDYGTVDASAFPPCMKTIVAEMQAGVKEGHQGRFVLSTFAINIGMPIEQIVEFYRPTPNFNEKKTRYYVEYSAGLRGSGVKYSCPGCEKMVSLGLCRNKDSLCSTIRHPLSYYAKKKKTAPAQPKAAKGAG